VTLCNPQNKNIVNRQILERLPTVLLSLRPLWELQLHGVVYVVQDFSQPENRPRMEKLVGGSVTFVRIPHSGINICLGVILTDLDEPG